VRGKNILFLWLLFVVLIVGIVITLGYPARPRFFPLIIMALCEVFVLVELVKAFRGSGDSEGRGHKGTVSADKGNRGKFAETLAWIGGFTLSIWLFGFAIGMPLFVLVYTLRYRETWFWVVALPAGLFVIIHVGFGILLETPLYEGWLFLR
jgi:hypothetical protein